jgi:hypothetical protein
MRAGSTVEVEETKPSTVDKVPRRRPDYSEMNSKKKKSGAALPSVLKALTGSVDFLSPLFLTHFPRGRYQSNSRHSYG